MILSALLSFLGGATARALIGHVIGWLEKKQNHKQELERIRLEGELEAARHARSMESIQLQAQLAVKQVEVQGAAAVSIAEANAFAEAMKHANAPTGNWFVDAWNGAIRPSAATISIAVWAAKIVKQGFAITAWDEQLVASILGYYFADRQLGKRK